MTPEELQILQKLISGPPDYQTPAPPPPPDLADPYNRRAGDYNKQATDLEKQADSPYPQPHGAKEHVVSALRAAMESFGRYGAPGGYYGQEEKRQKQFADENAGRISRAKELRGQAQQQQELGQTVAQRDEQNALGRANLDETAKLRGIQERAENRLDITANRPVVSTTSPGSTQTVRDVNGNLIDRMDVPPNTPLRNIDPNSPEGIRARLDFERNKPNPESQGKVQVQYTGTDGKPAVGTLDKATNTITPAHLAGDTSGATVQNATAGNTQVRAGTTATVDLVAAERLLHTMKDTLSRIESGQSSAPGADDMVLLSNHIAMTFGGVKGARTGRDLIEAHLKARSLPDSLAAAAERVMNGGQLTPGQRKEFVDLANRRVEEIRNSRSSLDDYFGGSGTPAPTNTGGVIELERGPDGRLRQKQ